MQTEIMIKGKGFFWDSDNEGDYKGILFNNIM